MNQKPISATRNQVSAALIVTLLVLTGLAYAGVTKISADAAQSARDKAEAKALILANAVEKKAFDLSVDTCRQTNPSRAFLQIRSQELAEGKRSTFISRVTPQIFAITDCVDTVRLGRPVLLPPKVEAEYLRMFKDQRIAITRGRRIVDSVPFSAYFTEAGAKEAKEDAEVIAKEPVPVPPGATGSAP